MLAPKTTGSTDLDDGGEAAASDPEPKDLKRKTARGAFVSVGAQAGTLVLRIGAFMILARLLPKEDFGLVNMVTAFTGFLGLLRDGLSMATVQRASVTRAQISALFWVNLGVGGLFAALTAVAAPILAMFYGEPRLYWVTVALGSILVINGAGAQHRAMLQRGMRFAVLAIIDIVSLLVGIAAGICMAVAGHRYWALVAMTISQPVVSVVGVWLATGWSPGFPQRRSGVRSMLAYGGAVGVNNLIAYLAYNIDKVLIGRFWGAEALGIYGRAYQLINLPNENLQSTIGLVAFPALSRVQNDPTRLAKYFLRGYGLFLSLVLPIGIGCALFAHDIILVLLGPQWRDAIGVFRLLAPAILALALATPFAWLMLASGLAARCIKIALVVTPVLILSYGLGLKHGPEGVAGGFSIAMVLCIVPVLLWAKQGTLITLRDILRAARPASISIAIAAAVTLALRPMLDRVDPTFVRLVAESTLLFGVYFATLLFIMEQKSVYMALLREVGLWPVGSCRTGQGRVQKHQIPHRLGKRFARAYSYVGSQIWMHLPASFRCLPPARLYGMHLHAVVRRHVERKQYFATFFFRNRPALDLMRRLLDQKTHGSRSNISVLACSKGAEVYSIAWTIRSARPDLKLSVNAVDISQDILRFAEEGVYSLRSADVLDVVNHEGITADEDVTWNTCRDQNASMFERMTDCEMTAMFDREGDQVRVKSWLKEGIFWHRGDAGDPALVDVLGPQDMVVANSFLCHMTPVTAERCLRNIARLVKPGGYLFVSGVDLDVRTKVAREMGWRLVTDLMREIHEGDASLGRDWPLEYWALEPFGARRRDPINRYVSVFQLGEPF